MKPSLLLVLLLCAVPVWSQIWAQTSDSSSKIFPKITRVPSITVTTTLAKRFKSPVPFSEISRVELERFYTVQDIPALIAELPSTIFYSDNGNNIGYSTLSIRGFDQRRIAVMINGVPQNDPEDHNVYWLDFPDITSNLSSIQVQRGAGHANYGHAAIGGSINLTSTNFAEKRSVTVLAGIGFQEFGANNRTIFAPTVHKYSIEVSSGLVPEGESQYAVYARASTITSDGYRDQSWVTMNSFFVSAARFDKNLTTQVNVFGGPIADGLAYTGIPKEYINDASLRRRNYSDWGYDATGKALDYSVTRRTQEIENFSQPHYELLNDWYIAPNLTFKSSLFYYSGEGFFDYDGSWADAGTLRLTADYGFPKDVTPQNALIRGYVGNRHYGWLPRLVWTHDDGELTAGVEARIHRSNHYGQIRYAEGLPSGFDPDYKFYEYNGERDIFSLFARENYRVNDALSVNIEAQVVRHTYRISNEKAGNQFTSYSDVSGNTVGNGGALFEVHYLFINPRLGVNYLVNEHLQAFASIAYTSREPRMKNLYAAEESYFGATPLFRSDTTRGKIRYDFSQPLVKPERMLDVEVGGRWSADGISLGANVYWMNFTNELVKNGQRDIFGIPVDGNAPRTLHYGIELEAAVPLVQSASFGRLWVSGNATFSVNKYVEFSLLSGNKEISLADSALIGFPSQLGTMRLSYERDDFFASVAGRFVGEFFTDNVQRDTRKNDRFTVFSADASYTFRQVIGLQSLKLRGQVNNLFNLLYSSGGVGKEFFPAAERNFFFAVELGL